MWWPFKSKFDKLTREDVVDAIFNVEKMEADIEQSILARTKEIEDLMEKGKKETNRNLKLFYAKKITALREENEEAVKRGMYLLYNAKLLRKLKTSIEDNNFFASAGKVSLNNLLADQKGLAEFLNKALNTKVQSENILTEADETWQEVQSGYEANEKIYGVANQDDELLAMFETQAQIDEDINAGQAVAGQETTTENVLLNN